MRISGMAALLALALRLSAAGQVICGTCTAPSLSTPQKASSADSRAAELQKLDAELVRMVEGGYPFEVFQAVLDGLICAQNP